jgi:thiol-disulfide isomerase/thioredoxin
MGKATRIKQQTAREKIAAQQAAARRAEVRRRALLAGGSVLVVIAIVVVLVVVHAFKKPSATVPKVSTQPASVVNKITGVPASVLNAVGKGNAYHLLPITNGKPLTLNGKPEVLYIGAEYCPYCAAERWAMAVAMSRFGTLSDLHFIHSSSTDVYPSTPTLTYYKSHYASSYIAFTPVEWYTNIPSGSGYSTLQPPDSAQTAIFDKYDAPPYVSSDDTGAFPFVDIGNKYLVIGAQYLPSVLAGKTWAQVAAALHDPSSAIAKGADGAANTITAAICKITGGKPASVCTSPAVTKANGAL